MCTGWRSGEQAGRQEGGGVSGLRVCCDLNPCLPGTAPHYTPPPPAHPACRLRELQELAARVQQQQEQAAGPGGPQPGQLSYSIAEQEDLQMRVAEAAEALAKLQVIVQGPPGGQELVSGEHAQVRGLAGLLAWHDLWHDPPPTPSIRICMFTQNV